jgi:cell division protein ZapA
MGELSIKIKIADREYPMKVKSEDEVKIRAACKSINERIKAYGDRFGIDDKQDLLAMAAFDTLIDRLAVEENATVHSRKVVDRINHLSHLIDEALS